MKAAQGRTKTRLALDPDRAPVVERIFFWRTQARLGVITITNRLNADRDAYTPPGDCGWTAMAVYAILRNPKYTGHMVFGRRRTVNGKSRPVPVEDWLWSPEPSPPRHYHPRHLGRRPGRRRRARHQPRRRRPQQGIWRINLRIHEAAGLARRRPIHVPPAWNAPPTVHVPPAPHAAALARTDALASADARPRGPSASSGVS